MAAKISLVSVQKPTANTPILQRRNKLTSNIDQQIIKIGSFREGKRISREQFWVDGRGEIFFRFEIWKNGPGAGKGEAIELQDSQGKEGRQELVRKVAGHNRCPNGIQD